MARKFTAASSQFINTPSISSGTSYTFSVWFNSPLSQAYDTVIDLGTSNELKFYVKSNGTTALYDGGTGVWDGTGAVTLSANTWYNLVLVITPTTATAYVNRTLDKSASATPGAISAASSYAIDGVGAHYSNSIMADGALWNVALTTDEISGLARGERPSKIRPASLLFYHPLYGIDSPEPDLSGKKNNATVVNFPTFNVGPPVNLSRPSFSSFLDPVSAAAQATATLTGSGALTASARVIAGASATLAGSGVLNAAAAGATASATLAGTGALSVIASLQAQTSAVLTGAGALTIDARRQVSASATLSGSGALTADARRTVTPTATLAGAGSLTATAIRVVPASATLAGQGALSATTTAILGATATLAGSGVLTAATAGASPATATLAGSGALSANAFVARMASATLVGTGGISVSGRLIAQASALFAGVGNLNATAQGGIATATLSGSGALTVSARVIAGARATLAGTGVLNARGNIKALASSTLVGNGLLQATAAFPVTTSNAILRGAGGLTASAIVLSTVKKADIFCELSAYEGDCALSAYDAGGKNIEEDDGDVFVRTAA